MAESTTASQAFLQAQLISRLKLLTKRYQQSIVSVSTILLQMPDQFSSSKTYLNGAGVYNPMNKEERFVAEITKSTGTNPKYYAICLLRDNYDANRLIAVAEKQGNATMQRLGYIAEAAQQAADMQGFPVNGLQNIADALYRPQTFDEWRYIKDDLPDWAKQFIAAQPQTELNKKWKVFSSTPVEDIANWIQMYLIPKQNVAASQR